ncbi:MAG: hypothetical protein A2908_01945 [Candidatus Staskawiczbacteria bacterium RIFCSPLOWO2_01_FULL_38_12b]|uniref:Uncharacterized protein n=1 Tax=Candidatus Staskawiczbacteria bacterium RIFCSPLOWO2_01_FULL_38_12b TaxID=1802214 RepID=A0A1G2IE82_9BACT|nr:MAG: hypothetical protein A2908_01945 [Candidatus Staskawiczbacteria bacterium RIFCSPLOWO2_01_FULL_38_12b]QBM02617.1 hypothetical protein [uncultured archaeon]
MLNSIVELYVTPLDSFGQIVHQDLWIHVNNPKLCLLTLKNFCAMNSKKSARIILIYENGNRKNHFQNSDGTIFPIIRELCS